MKKTFAVFALFALVSVASAQTQKGSVFLGATTNISGGFGDLTLLQSISPANQFSIGFGKTTYSSHGDKSTTKWNAVNFSPIGGYFVADGFMMGMGIGYLTIGSKDEDDDEKSRVNIFSATPILRYYFKQDGKVRPYAEARGGILNISYKQGDNDDSNSATLYGAKVGGAIFVGDRTSLDLFVDYSGTSSSDEGTKTTTSVFGIGAGLSFFLK